jgi:hypothetical protein
MNLETRQFEGAVISDRHFLVNCNSAEVPTTSFLDRNYAGVSALIGCASLRSQGEHLDVHVVHNPIADTPLPHGLLGGGEEEWFAMPVPDRADEYDLQRVTLPARETS